MILNQGKSFFAIILTVHSICTTAQVATLQPPPQDKGIPYTRSAKAIALEAIKDGYAVYQGSRYGYAKGLKTRLDEDNWKKEAILIDGNVYVPVSFASLLLTSNIQADNPPAYLKDKWTYSIKRNNTILHSNRTIEKDGVVYASFEDVAKSAGFKVTHLEQGLEIATKDGFKDPNNELLIENIVSQFDTPEKLANPDIATKYIPSLQRQGKWTDHVKVTKEQLDIVNGPEHVWPFTPESEFDYSGFNKELLGSPVPAPGVYPRLLFSPQDIPMLANRIKSNKLGQMSLTEIEYLLNNSWWNPGTSDGRVFQKLYSGDLAGLEWPDLAEGAGLPSLPQQFKDEKPGIHNSHIAYVPECLANMALYCLITNDDIHGKQAAAALANYYKLREPLLDEYNEISDSEFGTGYTRANGKKSNYDGNGGTTNWRNIHGLVAHMNLGLGLDFAGKWMTAEQKDLMRRIISKATYGRRGYGQDGPIRFRDINWVAWDLPNFLAVTAIEGLEGFDKEAYESNCETVRAFCEWGIDNSGVIYESNGKTPGGMQFHTLSMITLARRGLNLWGHPHVRKLLQGQIQMTSPSGTVVVNSGTQYIPFSRSNFSYQTTDEYKAFFPKERYADYIIGQAQSYIDLDENARESMREWLLEGFNPDHFRSDVSRVQRMRMPSPMYPGFVHGFLYDQDFEKTSRADLHLPLDFNAPVHGVFSGYSSPEKDATWINMMVRPDHYFGAGHHHADAGMIHFSALGVDWFTESPFSGAYDGKYHNEVLVDGLCEPGGNMGTNYQAVATYIGANLAKDASFASADLTNSYTYRWQTQPPPIWGEKLDALGWEMDPSPYIRDMFAGTAHYKMRPWWATFNYSNYIATSRAKYNPMEYVYRTVGIVRGGKKPYGIVSDDLKKDNAEHNYQWTAMLNGGVWRADVDGLKEGQVVLGFSKWDPKDQGTPSTIRPHKGDPLLLVALLPAEGSMNVFPANLEVTREVGPEGRNGAVQYYSRLAISKQAVGVNYRIALLPFKYGEKLPTLALVNGKTLIEWDDQKDLIHFSVDEKGRSHIEVEREGKRLGASK